MSLAEPLQAGDAAAGATAALVDFVSGLRYDALDDEVRHYARRHLLDTVGVMIAGAGGEVATRAEAMLTSVRAGRQHGRCPGRARRADLLDAAFLGGTAAHGIELDDGYRQGSVHPGCAVVPAVLAAGFGWAATAGKAADRGDGRGLRDRDRDRAAPAIPICASAAFIRPAPARCSAPPLAVAKLRGLSPPRIADALGLAASSAAGLFAFVNGGADIKRLHAGHAAREGLQAALLAEQGVEGPPDVLEARDGFLQAFAFGRIGHGAADRAAARGAVRHHRLLHQALCRAAATSSRPSRR